MRSTRQLKRESPGPDRHALLPLLCIQRFRVKSDRCSSFVSTLSVHMSSFLLASNPGVLEPTSLSPTPCRLFSMPDLVMWIECTLRAYLCAHCPTLHAFIARVLLDHAGATSLWGTALQNALTRCLILLLNAHSWLCSSQMIRAHHSALLELVTHDVNLHLVTLFTIVSCARLHSQPALTILLPFHSYARICASCCPHRCVDVDLELPVGQPVARP